MMKSGLLQSRKQALRMNIAGGAIIGLLSLATALGVDLEDLSINGSVKTGTQGFLSPAGGILPKTVFSSKLRLVFLVGLEGTGHHYMVSAFSNFFPDEGGKKAQQEGCKSMYTSLELEHSMKSSPPFYAKNIEKVRIAMRELSKHGSSLAPEEAVAMLCGKYSYPRNSGVDKVFQYIDLGTLADLAEQEGVDLRIIYLKRPAHDIAISTTVHRSFHAGRSKNITEGFMEYMRILMTDIAVMHSFLAGIDPAFVVCHDFDYLGDVGQVSRIAEHVVPAVDLVDKLISSLIETAPEQSSEEESLAFEGADFVVSRLQRHLDSYEFIYCTPQ